MVPDGVVINHDDWVTSDPVVELIYKFIVAASLVVLVGEILNLVPLGLSERIQNPFVVPLHPWKL